MEMTYDGTLIMPSSYVVIERDEMSYVEGGEWANYKGFAALKELTVIAGCAYAAGQLSSGIGGSILASASTGVGLLTALGLALGLGMTLAASAYEGTMTLIAATNMVESYQKTHSFNRSGYRANSYSIWTFTVVTEVGKLN